MDFLGLRHLKQSFSCAFAGFAVVWHETAFRQELVIGLFALPFAWLAPGLTLLWRVFLTLCWLGLPTMEVANTAIEAIVNLVSPEWNPLAKKAKDLGGAAVACVCLANLVAWGAASYKVLDWLVAVGAPFGRSVAT